MNQPTRRDILLLGAAALPATLALGQTAKRIRRSATDPLAQHDLDTLIRGVRRMKEIAVTNPLDRRSWTFWANNHGITEPAPAEMTAYCGKCQHGNPQFLFWHRKQLIWFERTIMELTTNWRFAMPYWDLFESEQIPPILASQTLPDGTANPLWHQNRTYWDVTTPSRDFLGQAAYVDMSRVLEANPHGNAHRLINGDMGDPKRSGRDPIFPFVHSFVDMCFLSWQARNPLVVSETFLNTSHTYSPNYTEVNRNVVTPQYYEYDRLVEPVAPQPAPEEPTITMSATSPSTGGEAGKPAARFRDLLVNVRVVRELTLHLPGGINTVSLQGIRALRGPFHYEVYVNLAPGGLDHEHHVGTISSFVLQSSRKDGLIFEVWEKREALQRKGLWPSGELRLSFVSKEPQGEARMLIGAVRGM